MTTNSLVLPGALGSLVRFHPVPANRFDTAAQPLSIHDEAPERLEGFRAGWNHPATRKSRYFASGLGGAFGFQPGSGFGFLGGGGDGLGVGLAFGAQFFDQRHPIIAQPCVVARFIR